MKKGQMCEGIIEYIDFPNKGRVKVEDQYVTVKNGIPGQKIRFVINKKRKDRCEGRLLEVLEKSPLETIEPVCHEFPACGGCMYQTMSYDEQLNMKAGQVKKLLDTAISSAGQVDAEGKPDYVFEGITGSPKQWAYRNKIEFSFGDEVTVTPRNFKIPFRYMGEMESHYAMIGMAHVAGGYPLYYDAINEKGLGMAGLNFVGNAAYQEADESEDRDNVAQYEFIPWILGSCASVGEARVALDRMTLTGTPFSEQLPTAQLHWIIADRNGAITVECMADGLHVYENPVGVLTNNPPFPQQMFLLNQYMGLSPKQPVNTFAPEVGLSAYSRGMGAMGLPGDLSSQSRFVRAAFVRANSRSGESEAESVSQFFHILGSVEQQRGCCELDGGK